MGGECAQPTHGKLRGREEELLYLTFVFSVQHAKQSKTNDCSIRLFVHVRMGSDLDGNKSSSDRKLLSLLETTSCKHKTRKKGQLNDMFFNSFNKKRERERKEKKHTILSIGRKSKKKSHPPLTDECNLTEQKEKYIQAETRRIFWI